MTPCSSCALPLTPCSSCALPGVDREHDAIIKCEVKDINEKLLFSVHQGANDGAAIGHVDHNDYDYDSSDGIQLRKPSIVRDPKGVIIGMLATDRTEEQAQPLPWYLESIVRAVPVIDSASILQTLQSQPASYTGYAARPRFAGQAAARTVEGVLMYAWFTFFAPGGGRVNAGVLAPNGGRGFRNSMIYLHGPAGLEPQRAYDYRLEGPSPITVKETRPAGSHFPWMFTVREAQGDYKGPMPGTSPTFAQIITGPFKAIMGDFVPRAPAGGTEAGVAYGDTMDTGREGEPSTYWDDWNPNPSTDPPRLIHHEVTIAKGMDAGLIVMAAFCPGLLNAEYEDLNKTGMQPKGRYDNDYHDGNDVEAHTNDHGGDDE